MLNIKVKVLNIKMKGVVYVNLLNIKMKGGVCVEYKDKGWSSVEYKGEGVEYKDEGSGIC